MSRVRPVEPAEDAELLAGAADGEGGVGAGARVNGVVDLLAEGGGAELREAASGWRDVHDDVRPAEKLGLGCGSLSCTSRSALQAR